MVCVFVCVVVLVEEVCGDVWMWWWRFVSVCVCVCL